MKHQISDDRKTLTITVDEDERQALRELEDIQSDSAMADFLEPLICNSELDWLKPEQTGDLTDAPILGFYADNSTLTHPIFERWAFMDYQVRSVLEDLRDKGQCVFVS